MEERPIRCRRARRGDAESIFALLTPPAPIESRAARHRFRQLVADLGADLYVALRDETVIGVVHVTYARQLTGPPRATVALVAAADGEGSGVGRALARLALERAQRRRCGSIDGRELGDGDAARAFVAELGAKPALGNWRVEIPVPRE